MLIVTIEYSFNTCWALGGGVGRWVFVGSFHVIFLHVCTCMYM